MPSIPPRLRRLLSPWNILTLVLAIWALPRLLPHVGAVVGVGARNPVAPEWSARTLDGTVLSSDSLRGRVVLVNVWATWCLPCRAEMPLLEAMARRHGSAGFTLVGLSVDRGPESAVREFLSERGIHYPVAIVRDDVVAAFGGVQGYPTSFLIDRAGLVRHTVIGPLAPASLELAVRRLLNAPSPGPSAP